MNKAVNMTQGKPLKLLTAFALPLMFGNIFQQMYTVVDTAVVGRGVGMSALAALGAVDWLNWLFLGIAAGFTQGYSVRVAQKFGQQDEEGLKQVLASSAVLSILVTIIATVFAQCSLSGILTLLRVADELRPMAELYSRIIMGGFPVMMFYNFGASCLRAVGDSKTPLYAMIAASIINIALDCIAVFVLDWGIAGAAAATIFAQLLAGVICIVAMFRNPLMRFGKQHLRSGKVYYGDLSRIGTPIAAKNVIIALGGIAIQSVVNSFDISFIAGFTATNKLYGLLEIAALSYGYAITTYVGQNYGAMRYDRIKSGIRVAVILSICISVVIAVMMFIFGRSITMIFISSDSAAMAASAGQTAYGYLCTMSAMLPMLYLLYVYISALQGIGNTISPMLSGILEFCLRVGLAFLVGYTGYQNGIFVAEVSAWVGSGVFLAISYYRDIKKLVKK